MIKTKKEAIQRLKRVIINEKAGKEFELVAGFLFSILFSYHTARHPKWRKVISKRKEKILISDNYLQKFRT